MGIDIREIDPVVHFECPKYVLSYWQEAGRCARDGRVGYSLILYDIFTLSIKSTNKDIANIIKDRRDSKDVAVERCVRCRIVDLRTVGEIESQEQQSCDGCDSQCCK